MVVRVPQGTMVHNRDMPFLVAVAVTTGSRVARAQKEVVVWYLPALAPSESFRQGKIQQVVDVFGPWASIDDLRAADLKDCRLPDPLVNLRDVLECNLDMSSEHTLPYDVLDALRLQHGIDVSAFSWSMTHKGNIYRSYVLLGRRGN